MCSTCPCYYYQFDNCKNAKCGFLHKKIVVDPRETHKTKMCVYGEKCSKGAKCTFAHSKSELKQGVCFMGPFCGNRSCVLLHKESVMMEDGKFLPAGSHPVPVSIPAAQPVSPPVVAPVVAHLKTWSAVVKAEAKPVEAEPKHVDEVKKPKLENIVINEVFSSSYNLEQNIKMLETLLKDLKGLIEIEKPSPPVSSVKWSDM